MTDLRGRGGKKSPVARALSISGRPHPASLLVCNCRACSGRQHHTVCRVTDSTGTSGAHEHRNRTCSRPRLSSRPGPGPAADPPTAPTGSTPNHRRHTTVRPTERALAGGSPGGARSALPAPKSPKVSHDATISEHLCARVGLAWLGQGTARPGPGQTARGSASLMNEIRTPPASDHQAARAILVSRASYRFTLRASRARLRFFAASTCIPPPALQYVPAGRQRRRRAHSQRLACGVGPRERPRLPRRVIPSFAISAARRCTSKS